MLTKEETKEVDRICRVIESQFTMLEQNNKTANRIVMDKISYNLCCNDFIDKAGNYPKKNEMFALPIVQVDTHEQIIIVKTKEDK